MSAGHALAWRTREWKCFRPLLGGTTIWSGSIPGARCRPWLMRQLGYYIAHFGVSGCMSRGHRFAWWEVDIGITEKVGTLQENGYPRALRSEEGHHDSIT